MSFPSKYFLLHFHSFSKHLHKAHCIHFLFFIAALTNCQKLGGSEQHKRIPSQFWRPEAGHRSHQAEITAFSGGCRRRSGSRSVRLLAEFSSLPLQDRGPCFPAGHLPRSVPASGSSPDTHPLAVVLVLRFKGSNGEASSSITSLLPTAFSPSLCLRARVIRLFSLG